MSRNSTPQRAELTVYLENLLRSSGIAIYAYKKPDDSPGGWNNNPGAPGSQYVPYSVINPLVASEPSGSLGDSGQIWRLPYSLHSYGISGVQTERQSDKLRKLVNEMERVVVVLGGDSWCIMKATTPTVGGIVPIEATAMTTYAQYDQLMIWISKE